MVSNINIFLDSHVYAINELPEAICDGNDSLETKFSWSNMIWRKNGKKILEENIDLKTICLVKDSEPISLPFLWKVEAAAEVCQRIGDGNITDFKNPEDISHIDIRSTYGEKLAKCQYIWTPYNDVRNEGEYINENNGEVVNLDWEPAQPNGLHLENHVALLPSIAKLRDIAGTTYACTSCTIPYKTVTLRGYCENSYLGKCT